MKYTNRQIAEKLKFFGQMLEILGETQFKVRAYDRAAETILHLEHSCADMSEEELRQLPGIGVNIAKKIAEYSATGTIAELEELIGQVPPTLGELLNLDGIGPRTVHRLWNKLGIESIDDLEKAAHGRRIRALSGFGPKKEQDILHAIERYRQQTGRMTRLEACRILEKLKPALLDGTYTVAGSYRRGKSTIGDIDIVTTDKPERLNRVLKSVADEVLDEGGRKTSIRVEGRRVDIRFTPPEQFGSMLMYLTGSKAFNIRLRAVAIMHGWKLNEYGIEDRATSKMHTFATESAMFAHLGMAYVPPELREDHGEVELACDNRLPHLVESMDIRGDLHVHSRWSDGTLSISELAREGEKQGYEYMVCTDHSASLGVARGLSAEDIKRQAHEIELVNRDSSCRILAGIEVDILADGKLAFPNRVLADLDLVIAAVHSGFKQEEDLMTRRVISATQNDHVDVIAHPTGRLLGRREPYAIDMERVVEAAADTDTALEINASPYRLDLDDVHVKMAVEEAVKIAIGTDSHSREDFSMMEHGVKIARRGWCEPDTVLNTYGISRLLEWTA